MITVAERQLRMLALVLTGILVLQLAWGALRWALTDAPDAILPAEASLRVDGVLYAAADNPELDAVSMASRPLFWVGRLPYVPPEGSEEVAPVAATGKTNIDKVALLGVYNAGANSGVIISHQGERRRLNMNESVEGWELTMLSPEGAIFENGNDSKVLSLVHAVAGKSKAAKPRQQKRVRRQNEEPTPAKAAK